jgi:hypothetical protein
MLTCIRVSDPVTGLTTMGYDQENRLVYNISGGTAATCSYDSLNKRRTENNAGVVFDNESAQWTTVDRLWLWEPPYAYYDSSPVQITDPSGMQSVPGPVPSSLVVSRGPNTIGLSSKRVTPGALIVLRGLSGTTPISRVGMRL